MNIIIKTTWPGWPKSIEKVNIQTFFAHDKFLYGLPQVHILLYFTRKGEQGGERVDKEGNFTIDKLRDIRCKTLFSDYLCLLFN